ncbi:M4 family metallopeptidase [Segetibacter koreensis]|uniref:M4 family metallopeptidase n=1 Tax=Segetibacter koreensis TaxID=398037 RepID=UPI00036EF3AB|nr:M4 family metallopeptidase [Segetibacter koreensis]
MKSKIFRLIYLVTIALLIMLLSVLPCYNVIAQISTPQLHPKLEILAKPQSTPNWIDFREGTTIKPSTIFTDLKDAFELSANDNMTLTKQDKDDLGFKNYRYQQYYKNLKVLYGEFLVHQQPDNFVKSANGRIIKGLNLSNNPRLTEKQALANALQFMKAKKYLWQNSEMEKELKRQEKNQNASYYPKGELVFAPGNYNATFLASDYKLAWSFKIYTDDNNVTPKSVFVDAITGQVIYHTDIAMNCSGGSGTSAFNGTVSINTTLTNFYFSHNDCQATNFYIYDCNGGGPANNLYSDADNAWTATSQQSAVQAQFGAAMTYSYYIGAHSRTSWDNVAGDLIAYNNANYAGGGVNNACWGCFGNNAIFGAGSTSAATDDWNTDDLMGHEFTHGVTQATASLAYQKESGGLNESFSDIFGEMVESWTEGNCDYLVGGDRGAIRSFINPKAFGQPDTYLGTNWFSTSGCTPGVTNDNCGVHTNSGVQNRWFYLLSEGGSGTNDLGNSYSVTGINRFKAREIAYRALSVYLSSSSQYIDARKATLEAAWDLYGQCSAEIIAVGDAWHAVGVESQSPQFAFNVCGTYPASGTFIQAISELTAANGCITEITPGNTTVYFTARDRVILSPGFKADNGSNFVAYLEPCSSTRWRNPNHNTIMSDAEKGLDKPVVNEPTPSMPTTTTFNSITINPNPVLSAFYLSINSKQNERARVIIYNSVGVKVKEKQGVNVSKGFNKISFDCSNLAKGVYMVEINVGDVKTVKKIVKM